MSKIKIKNAIEHSFAQNLIHAHNGGSGFRSQADIDNDKYHAKVTLLSIKNLIENAEWTKEELLEYVNSNIEGLELFNAKK